jgi:hypothetical protein
MSGPATAPTHALAECYRILQAAGKRAAAEAAAAECPPAAPERPAP